MSGGGQARLVRQFLREFAGRQTELSLNEIRVVLALERVVARLSADRRLSRCLIFKGGFALLKTLMSERFTRDLDASSYGVPREAVSELVSAAVCADMEDGFWFGDLQTEEIAEEGEHGGLRFSFAFQIGDPPLLPAQIRKLSRVHLDIAFGDSVPEVSGVQEMPSLVPGARPVSWCVYPASYIFAEKLQTALVRGSANSRAKDIYDLVFLYPHCMDRIGLMFAIGRVFSSRNTQVPSSWTEAFLNIDSTMLERSWKGVMLAGTESDFAKCWNRLREIMLELDRMLDS